MTNADAQAVLAIYQAGLDGGSASFETVAPNWVAARPGSAPSAYARRSAATERTPASGATPS